MPDKLYLGHRGWFSSWTKLLTPVWWNTFAFCDKVYFLLCDKCIINGHRPANGTQGKSLTGYKQHCLGKQFIFPWKICHFSPGNNWELYITFITDTVTIAAAISATTLSLHRNKFEWEEIRRKIKCGEDTAAINSENKPINVLTCWFYFCFSIASAKGGRGSKAIRHST